MALAPRLLKARFRAPQPTFDPASIANLAAWFDASDSSTLFDATTGGSLVAADGAVARWEDKSGNGRHATQGTANNRPLRKLALLAGRDALFFDGSNDALRMPQNTIGNSGNLSVFVVWERPQAVTSGTHIILNKGDAASFGATVWELESAIPWYGYANNAWFASVATTALPAAATFLFGGRTENRISQILVNNQNAGPASSQASGVNAISQHIGIMGSGTTGTGPTRGDVGEILIYDAALTTSEMSAVSDYLMTKWGIA
jgi:hypothetical protein